MYYWHWRGHFNTLTEFRALLLQYYNGVGYGRYGDEPKESRGAREARIRINRLSTRAREALRLTIGLPSILYYPAPAVGGYVKQLWIMDNLFGLHQYDIKPNTVLGFVDQALGALDDRRLASIGYTLNPLNWGFSLLEVGFHIPFRLMKIVGLNGDSVESSWVGKLLKLTMILLGVVEGLKKAGAWEQVLQRFGGS